MGALCSKQNRKQNPYADRSRGQEKKYQQSDDANKVVMNPQPVQQSTEKEMAAKESPRSSARYSDASDDEFYDGIPQYHRSSYRKSRSLRAAKVSEVGSFLGRAGSAGLGSVKNLSLTAGFVSGTTTRNNELSILSFEVANTIVKGSNLMQSLSSRSIRQLREVVLPEEGVQQLISNDMDELLSIVAADKREELKVFSGEVIRFGNRCKDPQWHNLDRFFEKRSRERNPQKQSKETAESVMMQLMTSVQLTAELYQEFTTLDRLEQNYQRKRLEELRFNAAQRGDRDNSLNILSGKLKTQRSLVKNLKKKSLWSRSMEEVMGKLVDIVLFLNQEINHTFGNPGNETPEKEISRYQQRLGPAGLALHYANIILQIDSIVARSSSMSQSSRDTLYQSLPPNIKDSLRSKLQSFRVEKELTVTEIKNEMEKTLHWLVPVATNTIKAHHGFGWVGEWGDTGSELNSKTVGPIDVMQIETLHHANNKKIEAYVLDLLLWLNYLVSRSKARANGGGTMRPSVRSPVDSPPKQANQQPSTKDATSTSPALSHDRELSNQQNSGLEENIAENELARVEARSSSSVFEHLDVVGEKSLDAIDRV